MVIILYFPISGLMMDDGTAPVINNILPAYRDKDLQDLGGSRLRLGQSFAFSWSLSASSY